MRSGGIRTSLRIALVAATAADARDVLVEGQSGVLAVSTPWFRPVYESSKRRVTWPNGAIATTFSAEEPIRAASHIARQVRIQSAAAADLPLSGDYRDM